MRRLLKLGPLCLATMLAAGGAAQAQDPIARGEQLAKQFCSGCHAIGRTGSSPNDQAPPFHGLQQSVDLDEFIRRLRRGLLSGHPDMPEFKFDAADARAMRDYIRSVQD
jgi:mono/diheme cytochrome c family protein